MGPPKETVRATRRIRKILGELLRNCTRRIEKAAANDVLEYHKDPYHPERNNEKLKRGSFLLKARPPLIVPTVPRELTLSERFATHQSWPVFAAVVSPLFLVALAKATPPHVDYRGTAINHNDVAGSECRIIACEINTVTTYLVRRCPSGGEATSHVVRSVTVALSVPRKSAYRRRALSIIGVHTPPGQITLILILCGQNSSAACTVSMIRPAFVEQ